MRQRLIVLALLLGTALSPAHAVAEAGTGRPVSVFVPTNTPFATALRAVVTRDTIDMPGYDAQAVGVLRVGTKEIGRLDPITLPLDGPLPTTVDVPVPAALVRAARNAGERTHHPRGTLTFVVTTTDRQSGATDTFGLDSYVSLFVPRRAQRRVSARFGAPSGQPTLVGGAAQVVRGAVRLRPPPAWLQTSAPGAGPATFLPRPLADGCRATVIAQPVAFAVTSLDAALRRIGGSGPTLASGQGPRGLRWRVKTGFDFDSQRSVPAAVGVQPVARHRYAGVRVDVDLDPACGPAGAGDRELRDGLKRLVRTLSVHVRLHSAR